MKKLQKDSLMEIKNTFKRFISILVIVLLGVGFFVGIKAASPDMKNTLDRYFDKQKVMDMEVISTLGLTNEDVTEILKIDGVSNVEGAYSMDAIIHLEEEEIVVKMHTLLENINQVSLKEGRFPSNDKECLVEESFLKFTGYNIGDEIEIDTEEDFFNAKKMKIVGIVGSPMYISRERGSTNLGAGKVNYYLYIPKEAVSSEVFTEIYLTLDNASELSCFEKKYDSKLEDIKKKLEEISEVREEERYQTLVTEANNKIREAEEKLAEEFKKAQDEINSAQNKINEGKKDLENSQTQLRKQEQKTDNELKDAENKLNQAKLELAEKEKLLQNIDINTLKQQLEELNKKKTTIQTGINTLNENKQEINKQKHELLKGIELLETNLEKETDINKIETIKQEIQKKKEVLNQVNEGINSVEIKLKELNSNLSSVNTGIETIQINLENISQLQEAKLQLEKKEKELKQAKEDAQKQFSNAKFKIEQGKKEIEENEEKLEEARKKAEEEVDKAQEEINDAKEKVKEINRPNWYILDRNANVGYASYAQDTDRIANIGKVFPVVFFVVAALISLTSMTRMVEEQRGEIGTLKALGYGKIKIASKYILYAILATVIGSLIGMVIGFNLLPTIVFDMYGMMYSVPGFQSEFNKEYAVTGMILACVCTIGATIYSCTKELKETPAALMRPKSPKAGKRVLLEHIPFLWSKLKFTQKVTLRNIFRYKKRFLMTIIGILGCTSLIVAGFGLQDSIGQMIPSQYGEIFKYDLSINVKEDTSVEEIEILSNKENIEDILILNMQNIEILDKSNTQSIQLIIPSNIEELNSFIALKNRKTNEEYILDNETIIVTEKIAKILNIKKGDTIRIKNADDIEATVTVGQITENYLMHYIYMSPLLYEKAFNKQVEYNVAFANIVELTEEQETIMGKDLLQNKNVSSISFISSTTHIFDEVMSNLDFVVWILIISAGLLAFVVLYNLSNVNISERIRELATIKVLGFYDKEVYKYVTRETVILTVIGIGLGLIGGYFLNLFIIQTCELDMLMFDRKVELSSYLYAIFITVIFTLIVNIVTYFSLKKIDMIESLKSVE